MSALFTAGYEAHNRLCREGGPLMAEVQSPGPFAFFCSGWRFTLLWSPHMRWFCGGDNEHGYLGQTQASPGIRRIAPLPELASVTPVWASAMQQSAMVVDTTGAVYAVGALWSPHWTRLSFPFRARFLSCSANSYAIIPEGPGIFYEHDNSLLKECDSVMFVDCAVGYSQFLAVSQNGSLYSWGRGKSCGQGRRKWSSAKPVKVAVGFSVARCFAGTSASFVIDRDGEVWACGANLYGQIGLGPLQKSNTFQRVVGLSGLRVVHIAIAENASYFLTYNGKLYASGDGENGKLLMDDGNSRREPIECQRVTRLGRPVSWVAAGSASVMLQLGGYRVLRHPIVAGKMEAVSYLARFPKAGGYITIDIASARCASVDFCYGERVKLEGMKPPLTFLGLSLDDIPQFVDDEERVVAISSTPMRANTDGEKVPRGRSEHRYRLRKDEMLLRPFGVYAADRVRHQDLGGAIVEGVYGGHLFFSWEGEKGVSTGTPASLNELHEQFRVEETSRSVVITTVRNVGLPVQVRPCPLLEAYDLCLGDLVLSATETAVIVGEFSVKAVIRDILTSELSLVLPSSLQLVRRETSQPTIVTRRYFNRSACDIHVNVNAYDELIPGDRIYTEKGFATVIGRTQKALVVQLDSAARLNLGVIEYSGKLKLIRRTSENMPRWGEFLPGDILMDNEGLRYMLAFHAGQIFLESFK
jgi:hypothetical protein